jgi:hypothetical protein
MVARRNAAVWNNAFGKTGHAGFCLTSKIFLDQSTPSGSHLTSLEVSKSSQNGVWRIKSQLVASFRFKLTRTYRDLAAALCRILLCHRPFAQIS